MKIYLLYQNYWDDPHSYMKGVTNDKNAAIHWVNTKPKEYASRDYQEEEVIEDILNLDRTINEEGAKIVV